MTTVILVRDATSRGLTRASLRTQRWEHPSRGLYAPAGSLATLRDRAAAFACVLPSASGFGHLTAAALRGWWLPWLPADLPLIATTQGRVHVQRPGLYVRRSPRTRLIAEESYALVEPAASLLEMAVDLALLDLVPVVDIALRTRACTREEINDVAWPGRRGAATLRAALSLSDPRSESPWESLLRLLHVLGGFTQLEPQAAILDDTGAIVGRADLRLMGTRRLAEYDGADHRSAEQHRADLARDKTLARLGLERYGYTSAEIVQRPARILADAEDAYGLPHDPRRVARWWQAAQVSTLTPQGRARLRHRLARYARASRRWERMGGREPMHPCD